MQESRKLKTCIILKDLNLALRICSKGKMWSNYSQVVWENSMKTISKNHDLIKASLQVFFAILINSLSAP